LIAKSLLRQEDAPSGDMRLTMLETIREYASEQLGASGELTDLRDRHLAHYLAFAETAKSVLQGPGQAAAFDHLERENDNLRAALEWSSAEHNPAVRDDGGVARASLRVEAGTRLAAALGFFWVLRGRGRESLPRVLSLVALAPPGTSARARALTVAAHVYGHMLGDYQSAAPLADEGLRTWRALGDQHGIAVALIRQGQIAFETGEYQRATMLFTEARTIFRNLGGESGPEVPTTLWLAEVAQAQGAFDRAQSLYDEVLAEARVHGDGHAVAHALRELARLRRAQGDSEQALMLLRESAARYVPLKDIRCACILLEDLAGVLCERHQPADAARLFGAAEALRRLSGRPLTRVQLGTHNRDLAAVEQQLAPETFTAAWAEGQAMSLEQAIQFAATRPATD
jgi:tetratricopeptide (TPR) repeat protein